jgi:hypothetical protein
MRVRITTEREDEVVTNSAIRFRFEISTLSIIESAAPCP